MDLTNRGAQQYPDAERLALAWWSGICEPNDHYLRLLLRIMSAAEAREWLMQGLTSSQSLVTCAMTTVARKSDWDRAIERWKGRAREFNIDRELTLLYRNGGNLLTQQDYNWPASLNDLGEEQPLILWARGELKDTPRIAIVGARACSHYGERQARNLSYELAEKGICIISGGAFGIDAVAHQGALDAHGQTWVWMAGGVINTYPRAHGELFAKIIDNAGALISEMPSSFQPARWRFLERNRLIAASAHATVVVEAPLRSGALSTARHALSLGREVGAIPGSVESNLSDGVHQLIRHGAELIRHGDDALEMLAATFSARFLQGHTSHEAAFGNPVEKDQGIATLDPRQQRVWQALPQRSALETPKLVAASGLGHQEVLEALANLQLHGWAARTQQGWKRSRPQ